MEIRLNADGLWYHGSDKIFSELNENAEFLTKRPLKVKLLHALD